MKHSRARSDATTLHTRANARKRRLKHGSPQRRRAAVLADTRAKHFQSTKRVAEPMATCTQKYRRYWRTV